MRWGLLSAAMMAILPSAGAGRLLRRGRLFSSLAVRATRLWVSLFVRDLGLCPFASWLGDTDASLRVAVTRVSGRPTAIQVAEEVLREARLLLSDSGPRSTLLLYPALGNFDRYLESADMAVQALAASELDKHVQLATFHPRYRFRDEHPASATQWTNRSPFPMIHLLRVDDVGRAIEVFSKSGDPDEIWRRNQRTMLAMGTGRLREMRREIMRRAVEESCGEPNPLELLRGSDSEDTDSEADDVQ